MERKRAKVLILGLFVLPSLGGALAGWFLAADQEPFVRIMSPFLGAAGALGLLSIALGVARAFLGILKVGRTPAPSKLDLDWRTTSRLMNERARGNYRWLSRWSWPIALIFTMVMTGVYIGATQEFLRWLIAAPFIFLLIFVVLKYTAKFSERLFAPWPPAESERSSVGHGEGPSES